MLGKKKWRESFNSRKWVQKKIYRTGNLGEGGLQRVTVSVRKLKDEELINASEQWGGMIIAVLYLLYMVMMEARTQ